MQTAHGHGLVKWTTNWREELPFPASKVDPEESWLSILLLLICIWCSIANCLCERGLAPNGYWIEAAIACLCLLPFALLSVDSQWRQLLLACYQCCMLSLTEHKATKSSETTIGNRVDGTPRNQTPVRKANRGIEIQNCALVIPFLSNSNQIETCGIEICMQGTHGMENHK